MKAADRIESFRNAVQVLLSDSPDMRVIVELNSTNLTVIGEYKTIDGERTYYSNAVTSLDRPDLRRPIPAELVREAVEKIVRIYDRNSRDRNLTEVSRERARKAWELCKV